MLGVMPGSPHMKIFPIVANSSSKAFCPDIPGNLPAMDQVQTSIDFSQNICSCLPPPG
jgi:hypothetical protein